MSNKANYEKTFWKKIFSSPVYLIDKNLCEEVTEVLISEVKIREVYNKCLKKFIKLVLNKMYISNFVCSSKLYNCDLIIQNK